MNLIYSQTSLKLLPFCILIFVCLGCATMETVESTKIPQSEIRQTYVVTATREKTQITAYFNQGSWGKSVDLDAPSKIEHNGAELPQNSVTFLTGTIYTKQSNGTETNHKFVYTNNDGKVFRNEMSFAPINLVTENIVISRSQETKIQLSRTVGADEKVSISLNSLEKRPDSDNSNAANKNAPDFDLGLNNELDDSRAAIILKPKNLKKFVNGKVTLTVEISREQSLQQQTEAGGTMTWRYTSTAAANITN